MRQTSAKLLWRKAAIIGSLWAASEIVLGSFLHNARVPFKGELLTAIGIAILVAGHRLWPQRGLLWRAGLVCAAMKSVSPSAVIFGPMLAISMEGFLAEAGVWALGGNFAGYLLGGGLAMSWAIIHKTGSTLMMYGPDTINLYIKGLYWVHARTGIGPENVWTPLFLLLGLYFLAGALAAAAGMRAGTDLVTAPAAAPLKVLKGSLNAAKTDGRYSIAALLFHIVLLAAVMAAGKKITAPALCALSALYAAACAVLYPRARALLSRAGVWAGVLGASLLAGLLMGSAAAGFYMALRAFMLTFGFSAIGSELLNPRIRARLERLGGGVFFETLEYAFSALPGMIAALPAGREIARRPVASLRAVISRAPALLDAPERPALFLITGVQGSGKSQLVAGLAEGLRRAGKKPGGICAEGFWENGARAGFDLINLASGARAPLCRRGKGGKVRAGAFRFYEEGLAAGAQALSTAGLAGADAVFVDEVGFLELEGGGWAGPLKELCHSRRPLILAVRDSLADKVPEHFGLDRPVIWKAGHVTAQDALPALLAALETAQKTAG